MPEEATRKKGASSRDDQLEAIAKKREQERQEELHAAHHELYVLCKYMRLSEPYRFWSSNLYTAGSLPSWTFYAHS